MRKKCALLTDTLFNEKYIYMNYNLWLINVHNWLSLLFTADGSLCLFWSKWDVDFHLLPRTGEKRKGESWEVASYLLVSLPMWKMRSKIVSHKPNKTHEPEKIHMAQFAIVQSCLSFLLNWETEWTEERKSYEAFFLLTFSRISFPRMHTFFIHYCLSHSIPVKLTTRHSSSFYYCTSTPTTLQILLYILSCSKCMIRTAHNSSAALVCRNPKTRTTKRTKAT